MHFISPKHQKVNIIKNNYGKYHNNKSVHYSWYRYKIVFIKKVVFRHSDLLLVYNFKEKPYRNDSTMQELQKELGLQKEKVKLGCRTAKKNVR